MQSFAYESKCTVFTILYLWFLPSLSKCVYIYILRIYGLYLAISKVSTFPCPFQKQWLSVIGFFLQKWRKASIKRCLLVKFPPKKFSQNNSTKHSFKQVFHEQILKRNLHKINLWKDISTQKIEIETSTTKYLTTQFLPELSNEKSLPNKT